MRSVLAGLVLLFSLVTCRSEGAPPPADPGFDEIESTLDSVEAEVSEP